MDSERWDQIQSLFIAALDHGADDQAAFLEKACAGDADLRHEVDALLHAHEDSHALGIENRLLANEPAVLPEPELLLGTRIGPYRLQKVLGQGGMGKVFLAERDDDQYRQEVALKLVRPGFNTADVVRRFRAERQILARLVHPNIARLHDGGMTPEGQPYLVMEYIEGVPITEFCDTHRLSVEDRLRLFRVVCGAVQFAHRNLVIHRDLKPSNILVTEQGEIKLLDFGIAKLMDPAAVGFSVALTRSEIRVMTPEYAAPEQVRGAAITTATDVYALGVLLYELLTGHRPYRLMERLQAEVERIICEEEPTRPSTVVGEVKNISKPDGTTEALTPERVSAARATQVSRLQRILKGDLDNVVMMTLRKEPERRYASAEQLAEDVDRFLNNRPVIAQQDTLGYRARKFIRRNRVGVTVTMVFMLLLIGFSALTAEQARRVARERDLAHQETQKAEQVTALLMGLFESAAPATAPRDTMRVRDVLEAGAARAETLAGQPAVQAQLFTVLGQTYWNLGRPDRAAELEAQALALRRHLYGVRHPETAASLYWLGVLRQELDQYDQALAHYRESLEAHRALYGDDHLSVVKGIYRIGHVLHMTGRSREADSLFTQWEHALQREYAEDDPDLATMLGYMGAVLQYKGRLEEAEAYIRQALAMQHRLYGNHDARLGDNLHTLVNVLIAQQRPAEAEAVAREALALHRDLYPDGHFALARSLDGLGESLLQQGRYDEAEPALQEALALYSRLYDENDLVVGRGYTLLAHLYHRWGRYDEAEPLYRHTIALYERRFGQDYPVTIERRAWLADMLRDRGDYAAAEHLLLEGYQVLRDQRGLADRYTQEVQKRLVKLYEAWGKPQEAEQYSLTVP